LRIALYQPEIPQNVGTLIRLGACVGVGIDVIEPTSFVWNDKYLKRAGMDYIDMANVTRTPNWQEYLQQNSSKRIVLLDTKATTNFYEFSFMKDDILLLGKESIGVPDELFNTLPSVKIPMLINRRSLNVAIAGAMVLTEALRQTNHANPPTL
jgi:tRNA (cytidine/uridine-2'-O-)-methyltransferase